MYKTKVAFFVLYLTRKINVFGCKNKISILFLRSTWTVYIYVQFNLCTYYKLLLVLSIIHLSYSNCDPKKSLETRIFNP